MKSMTGFATEEGVISNGACLIEIKSINHRFLDIRCRMPSDWNFLEPTAQEKLRKVLKRGTLEVNVRPKYASLEAKSKVQFAVDEASLESYIAAHKKLQAILGDKTPLNASDILRNEKLVVAVEENLQKETIEKDFLRILDKAIEKLVASRRKEGLEILNSFQASLEKLQANLKKIEQQSIDQPEELRKKLLERIERWKLKDIDSNRLEWEVAFYADRCAIGEEIDRLGSHIKSFQEEILKEHEMGRRLDFITQEMHREINTIGSKTQDIEITRLCIASKAEIEKLREQAQNVE